MSVSVRKFHKTLSFFRDIKIKSEHINYLVLLGPFNEGEGGSKILKIRSKLWREFLFDTGLKIFKIIGR